MSEADLSIEQLMQLKIDWEGAMLNAQEKQSDVQDRLNAIRERKRLLQQELTYLQHPDPAIEEVGRMIRPFISILESESQVLGIQQDQLPNDFRANPNFYIDLIDRLEALFPSI